VDDKLPQKNDITSPKREFWKLLQYVPRCNSKEVTCVVTETIIKQTDEEHRMITSLHQHASRPAPGPAQPPIQRALGALSPGGEAVHSSPSSAEVKNAWSYTSIPTIRLYGVVFS